jgi:glycine/D-amino acid oxidase-like deaminating enzyme
VLIATNGYTSAVTPALQRRLVPIGSYIIVTEPLAEDAAHRVIPRRRMVFDTKHFLYYFRLTSDRRLLFGGRAQFGPVTPDSTRYAAEVLRRALTDVFPELSVTRIDYAWSGTVAFTRDEMPISTRRLALTRPATRPRDRDGDDARRSHRAPDRGRFRPAPSLDGIQGGATYRGDPWFLPLVGHTTGHGLTR